MRDFVGVAAVGLVGVGVEIFVVVGLGVGVLVGMGVEVFVGIAVFVGRGLVHVCPVTISPLQHRLELVGICPTPAHVVLTVDVGGTLVGVDVADLIVGVVVDVGILSPVQLIFHSHTLWPGHLSLNRPLHVYIPLSPLPSFGQHIPALSVAVVTVVIGRVVAIGISGDEVVVG
jgi:hypothetical protein